MHHFYSAMDQGRVLLSPAPQRPVGRIQINGCTTQNAACEEITADKIAWLYNSLAVLKRESDRNCSEKETLWMSVLRKRLVQQATKDCP
jgi:hypothetical protein